MHHLAAHQIGGYRATITVLSGRWHFTAMAAHKSLSCRLNVYQHRFELLQVVVDLYFQNRQSVLNAKGGIVSGITGGTDARELSQCFDGCFRSDHASDSEKTRYIFFVVMSCTAFRTPWSDQPPPLVQSQRRNRYADALGHLTDLHGSEFYHLCLGAEPSGNFRDTPDIEAFGVVTDEE